MKKFLYSSVYIAICCLTFGQAQGQVSFTNQVANLTDPTHYSGVALTVQDMNNDGLDDLVILDNARDLKIEYQKMDGVWTSVNGGEMDGGNAWGMAAGDATNNGHGDVFSGLFGGRPDYAKANASGTSYTITELPTYSLATQCVNLADMDGDGDLDFFSCGDTGPSGIWENNGSGAFTYSGDDIIPMTPTGGWDGSGNYGSTFTDYDLDGDLDLYITHCRQGVSSSSDLRRINQMFINDGNNNYAEDFTNANGLRIGAQSWTTDFQDIDNDGDFDAFITNHDVDNMLLENVNNVFTDIFSGSGLDMSVGTPIQGIMRDFDNDMYVDIIVTGSDYAFYKNNGDQTFTKINNVFGANNMESLAVGDLNHDGFLDVYGGYANIYTTPTNIPDAVWINDGNDNNWFVLDLEGTVSNRSAVGAVARLYGPWGMQVREVRSGESYGICNSLMLHFGLAQNTEIDSVVIDWPLGIHQVIENPSPNQFLKVIESECVAPEAFITANGPVVLCQGQSLDLMAPAGSGYAYEWSTGGQGQSISVTTAGTYMVRVTDTNAGAGCTSVSAATVVEVSPDETPEVTATGDLAFCEGGSVTLTSSSAAAYEWSNNLGTAQNAVVTEAGSYTVTITGACADFTSTPIVVEVFDAPAPTADDVVIPNPGTADLTASGVGTDFNWYDQPVNGAVLGTGPSFTTPVVTTSDMFYVEEVHTYGGATSFGAKEDNSTGGVYHTSTAYYNLFDVNENCRLVSVKVYADGEDDRTLYIEDASQNLIHSETFTIPDGESRVYLTDWDLTPGTDYRFRILESNHGLWRDNNGGQVNFPYAVSDLISITNSNTSGDQYYYYYYDWEVEAEAFECVSDRTEVNVMVGTVGIEEDELEAINVYPNPAVNTLNVEIPASIEDGISIRLMDVTGSELYAETAVSGINSIDVSSFAKGVYIIELNSDKGTKTQRFMVQ